MSSESCTDAELLGGLPLELWRLILSYLDVLSLCKATQVCKSWQQLVESLDGRTWRQHFLRCGEWRHPAWPRQEDAFPVKSWQTTYKEHYLTSRLWSLPNRSVDQGNCLHVTRRRREARTIRVGPGLEHKTLKSALTVACDYDRIVLSPGVYDEQFEMSSKIPFEIVGDGELGSVVLLTCIEQASLSARLCNLVLRAPWFTAHVIRVIQGHLQVDRCIIEDGQVSVQAPGTAHMKYCSFVKTQVTLVQVSLSLFENCDFTKADNCAVIVDQPPKDDTCWVFPYLSLLADTYKLKKRTWIPPVKGSLVPNPVNKELGKDTDSLISDTGSKCYSDDESGCLTPLSSESESDSSSDSECSTVSAQPWVGHARAAWVANGPEPPSQWDVDPIPDIPGCLHHDVRLRETVSNTRGTVFRRCVISQCQGGISLSRQAQLHVHQCQFRDLQYGIRCLHNTKLAAIENIIHHCATSALFLRLNAGGVIIGNDIYCTGEAGIDIRKNADPLIQHNRIHHSKRSGVVVLGGGRGTIKANDIYQNREAAIYILYKGDPYVSGNRICHGAASGIAVTEGGKGYILDNMISGNRWGGIDIRRGGDPKIVRNLICNGLADGIVVGVRGKATIEANCIRGNMGCGVWVMSGHPLIQSNQIYSNKDAGIVLLDKADEDLGDESVDGSNSDSEQYECDPPTPSPPAGAPSTHTGAPNSQGATPSTSSVNVNSRPLHINYNSIYHNADVGILCNMGERLELVSNTIHGNRNTGVCVKQAAPVHLSKASITCNSGSGLHVTSLAKVKMEESGIYDNTAHGIRCEGQISIDSTDILCNQMAALWTDGNANLTIEKSRLYSPYDPVLMCSGKSQAKVVTCKVYKGRCEVIHETQDEAEANMDDIETLEEHGHMEYDKRGFDWQLEDPPPRPNIEAPPRVNIPATPARRVTTATRVRVPTSGGCQQGSKTCIIL